MIRAGDDVKTLIIGAAGAGSLILEFAVLSRLTGDARFEVGLLDAGPHGPPD